VAEVDTGLEELFELGRGHLRLFLGSGGLVVAGLRRFPSSRRDGGTPKVGSALLRIFAATAMLV
jgi:hypothetical protein